MVQGRLFPAPDRRRPARELLDLPDPQRSGSEAREAGRRRPQPRQFPRGSIPASERRRPPGFRGCPVGRQFPGSASHYGTLDQGGNAWEWIEATVFGTHRVIRGGSMCASHEKLLSKVRTHATPTRRYPDTGFRLARAMPKPGPTPTRQP